MELPHIRDGILTNTQSEAHAEAVNNSTLRGGEQPTRTQSTVVCQSLERSRDEFKPCCKHLGKEYNLDVSAVQPQLV